MARPLRIGIVGCDTSHCVAFTKLITQQDAVPAEVVACYPSFSPDIAKSAGRVDKLRETLITDYSVQMVDSIKAMHNDVDAFILASLDGRRHLPELRELMPAGKPVYIDKPFAASYDDAKRMADLVEEHELPCFSASSLRFDSAFTRFIADKQKHGAIIGCDAFSPAHLEPTNPGWFWYGIHGVEILYTFMGTGCETVHCVSRPDGDFAVGTWRDGRIGTMRGIRAGQGDYGARVLAEKTIQPVPKQGDFYARLVDAILAFFKTGNAPVPIQETVEMCGFIESAWQSARLGGQDRAI
jgi:predicted dehydrogenase